MIVLYLGRSFLFFYGVWEADKMLGLFFSWRTLLLYNMIVDDGC